MSTRIRQGLIDIATRIGRWLLQRLARVAIVHLVGYMRGKIEDFGRRRNRGKTDRRRAWLSGRIARWSRAARWLERHATALGKCSAGAFAALAKWSASRLPMVSACERLVAA